MALVLENAAPIIKERKAANSRTREAPDDNIEDPIDAEEVFDLIRDINDPEHPYSLEQLNVVQEELISIERSGKETVIHVEFVPTIPHCSMAALIGLTIKTLVSIKPGTHMNCDAINRQLADKERVCAAMQNPSLMASINHCLRPLE